jgi:ABC-type Fe3+ transport system permease subunit
MLETIAWTVVLMGLGAIIVVLVGVAIVWMCREDI